MKHLLPGLLALLLGGGLAFAARAQAPAWVLATAGLPTATYPGYGLVGAATDAADNVFVTGVMAGPTVQLGSYVLTNAGGTDLFVAKYVPASSTWAWAYRAGGRGGDAPRALAVSGNAVYVTGYLSNDLSNSYGVTFDGTAPVGQLGTSTNAAYSDIFVAKYVDNGATASVAWTQVAGGSNSDFGFGVAVSGSSVYVAGTTFNNLANVNNVRLGGSGTTVGTQALPGASATVGADAVLLKYTDNGSSASVGWAQVAGGTGTDEALGVAVGSTGVYLVGDLTNDLADSKSVRFGGSALGPGTQVQRGASAIASYDVVLARYVDLGSTAAVAWTQVAGGTGIDKGYGVAVSGSRVYVAGTYANNAADGNAVRLGGSGAVAGTVALPGLSAQFSQEALLACYADAVPAATVAWTQAGGGRDLDQCLSVTAVGAAVYTGSYSFNDAANGELVRWGVGSPGAAGVPVAGFGLDRTADVVLAGYLDQGSAATLSWVQTAGGPGDDLPGAVVVAGTRCYLVGNAVTPARFGALDLQVPAATRVPFLAAVDLTTTLATVPTAARPGPTLYPNPVAGPAVLSGAAPATAGQVLDGLGRVVATFCTDAGGAVALPAGLAPGLYLVRVGPATARWVVE